MGELATMSDLQLTAIAARLVGADGPFAPLANDADCFLLATRFTGLQLDLIVARAHASFHQLELVRRYVRRNVVLAAVRIHFMTQRERDAHDW